MTHDLDPETPIRLQKFLRWIETKDLSFGFWTWTNNDQNKPNNFRSQMYQLSYK